MGNDGNGMADARDHQWVDITKIWWVLHDFIGHIQSKWRFLYENHGKIHGIWGYHLKNMLHTACELENGP